MIVPGLQDPERAWFFELPRITAAVRMRRLRTSRDAATSHRGFRALAGLLSFVCYVGDRRGPLFPPCSVSGVLMVLSVSSTGQAGSAGAVSAVPSGALGDAA